MNIIIIHINIHFHCYVLVLNFLAILYVVVLCVAFCKIVIYMSKRSTCIESLYIIYAFYLASLVTKQNSFVLSSSFNTGHGLAELFSEPGSVRNGTPL